jgi:hypothetical protein
MFDAVNIICDGVTTQVEDDKGNQLSGITMVKFEHCTGQKPKIEITFTPQLFLFDGSTYEVTVREKR